MNSPFTLKTLIIALVFALVGYFLVKNLAEHATIAVPVLAFIAVLVSAGLSGQSEITSSDDEEIKTLYVGNLPYRANEAAVRSLFEQHGKVSSVRLMKDKQTGKRRGFGFVEIASGDIEKIISALNDTEFQQRTLKVREAKERPEGRTNNDD